MQKTKILKPAGIIFLFFSVVFFMSQIFKLKQQARKVFWAWPSLETQNDLSPIKKTKQIYLLFQKCPTEGSK